MMLMLVQRTGDTALKTCFITVIDYILHLFLNWFYSNSQIVYKVT